MFSVARNQVIQIATALRIRLRPCVVKRVVPATRHADVTKASLSRNLTPLCSIKMVW
jgi:hypothetical protein